jgi:hypothetical protein
VSTKPGEEADVWRYELQGQLLKGGTMALHYYLEGHQPVFSIAFCGFSCYIWLASLENVLYGFMPCVIKNLVSQ